MRQAIVLTGATGFLGSHVARALCERKHPLVILHRSSSDMSRLAGLSGSPVHFHNVDALPLDQVFAATAPRLVLHCATRYSDDPREAASVVEANVLFPLRLVECCFRHDVCGFVNIDTTIHGLVTPYALSKAHFVDWLRKIACRRMGVGNMPLGHFFGPGDAPHKFVPFVVRELVAGRESLRLTPGMQQRNFVYITDVVDAVLRVVDQTMTRSKDFEEYQVGSDRNLTIKEFVGLIKTLSGNTSTRLDFGALPYREHELMEVHVDTRQLVGLGWSPAVSLEEGLMRMILAQRRSMET